MSNLDDDILDLADRYGDKAPTHIYTNRDLALHAIHVGIETIKSRARRRARREIKHDIKPEFVSSPSSPYAVRFTKDTLKRIAARGKQLMEDWVIGGLVLGDLTREELLRESEREQIAGAGHILNANIYAALAEPLDEGQKMRAYWTYEKAGALYEKLRRKELVTGV